MATKKTNPDYLNGVPELLILQLLIRQPMHGYDLVQTIRQASGLRLDFGEGCVYPILHRLEEHGLLSSERKVVGGRSRIVYRTTRKGLKRFEESLTDWKEVIAAVNAVLQGGSDVAPGMA